MTDDIQSFLATSPVFQDVPPKQLAAIAPLFQTERYRAGTLILHQGDYSPAVYFLRSGRLVVRVQRGEWRETVAHLLPPAIVGELSFFTGRRIVADVEVEVDAELVFLTKEAFSKLPKQGDLILSGLMGEIAGRLHDTVAVGANVPESPIALFYNHPNWEAPLSFASELACSLARQTGRQTLLVNLGTVSPREVRSLDGSASACSLAVSAGGENLRADVAEKLTTWKGSFENVLLNPVGPQAAAIAETIKEFTNFRGDLLGPGDPVPGEAGEAHFIVQSAARPTLPFLNGRQQLVFDAADSERAYLSGHPVTSRFQHSVDSIARCIAGLQVGLTLGAGAAWGWAHIGALSVLEDAGLPIDCISGSSWGSYIGAARSSGYTIQELKEMADSWPWRSKRLREWRFWRMCLLNERVFLKALHKYLGDRLVNRTEIPYWANCVDIQTGREHTIRTGTLVECVRASAAFPGLWPPWPREGHLMVDGAGVDPVPVKLVQQMGCHFSIAINVMAKIESPEAKRRYPFDTLLRFQFNTVEILSRFLWIMAREIGQARAERTADVVFTPEPGGIGILDFSRGREIIECGRKAAEEHLPAILAGYERLKASSRRQ